MISSQAFCILGNFYNNAKREGGKEEKRRKEKQKGEGGREEEPHLQPLLPSVCYYTLSWTLSVSALQLSLIKTFTFQPSAPCDLDSGLAHSSCLCNI